MSRRTGRGPEKLASADPLQPSASFVIQPSNPPQKSRDDGSAGCLPAIRQADMNRPRYPW